MMLIDKCQCHFSLYNFHHSAALAVTHSRGSDFISLPNRAQMQQDGAVLARQRQQAIHSTEAAATACYCCACCNNIPAFTHFFALHDPPIYAAMFTAAATTIALAEKTTAAPKQAIQKTVLLTALCAQSPCLMLLTNTSTATVILC